MTIDKLRILVQVGPLDFEVARLLNDEEVDVNFMFPSDGGNQMETTIWRGYCDFVTLKQVNPFELPSPEQRPFPGELVSIALNEFNFLQAKRCHLRIRRRKAVLLEALATQWIKRMAGGTITFPEYFDVDDFRGVAAFETFCIESEQRDMVKGPLRCWSPL